MEAFLILANFIAMVYAMLWSARAEGRGRKGGADATDGGLSGFFAYTATLEPAPPPVAKYHRHRPR